VIWPDSGVVEVNVYSDVVHYLDHEEALYGFECDDEALDGCDRDEEEEEKPC